MTELSAAEYTTFRRDVIRFSTELSKTAKVVPSALFLTKVELFDTEPVAQGSFTDTYKGRTKGQIVAVKRLHVFLGQQSDLHRDAAEVATIIWRGDNPFEICV